MATTVTRRPYSTRLNLGDWFDHNGQYPSGFGSEVNDGTDATWVKGIGDGPVIAWYTASYTLASNQRCAKLTFFTRVGDWPPPVFSINYDGWIRPEGVMGDGAGIHVEGTVSPSTFSAIYDAEFTQSALNNSSSWHRSNAGGVTSATVYDTWVDLDIRTKPV